MTLRRWLCGRQKFAEDILFYTCAEDMHDTCRYSIRFHIVIILLSFHCRGIIDGYESSSGGKMRDRRSGQAMLDRRAFARWRHPWRDDGRGAFDALSDPRDDRFGEFRKGDFCRRRRNRMGAIQSLLRYRLILPGGCQPMSGRDDRNADYALPTFSRTAPRRR